LKNRSNPIIKEKEVLMITKDTLKKNNRTSFRYSYSYKKFLVKQNRRNPYLKCNKNTIHHNDNNTRQKLISIASYFTFGLAGLLIIIINFFNQDLLTKSTLLHIAQATFLGIATAIFVFLLNITGTLVGFIHLNSSIGYFLNETIYNLLPVVLFCLSSIFSLFMLLERDVFLPGLTHWFNN
jgi:hypothetical protein